ncbi:MAG: WD40/YVTN/BNR-like repeat-containing protein [Candidatus Eiseniibacteriota bacterium]
MFADADTGTVVGFAGTILRTTDGGQTWVPQESGTVHDLFDVFFTDTSTGTVVGESGTVLRTVTGGVK